VEVALIGAGFSGIAAAVALIREGIEDFVILERADDVGGVWRDNTYPGIACDIPSKFYSLSFAPNPDWRHTFSRGPEIAQYARQVTDDHGVRFHIRFGQELLDASWDDEQQHWTPHHDRRAADRCGARGLYGRPGGPADPGHPRA
jgi:cation diffusion facilitator CzcD-associated flavoprotein CzcO